VSYTPTTDDNIGVTSESCTVTSGSVFVIGVTSVTCTATDAAGNSTEVTFDVTVTDGVYPTISQANITVEATVPAGIAVSYTPTTDDNIGVTSESCTVTSGSVFVIGVTSVTCTATDAAGNSTEVTFDVTVTDGVAPTLILPADITAEATSTAGANVPYSIIATDNTGVDPTVTCTPASGSLFAIGDTPITCTATDGVGNSASGSFTVTVQDNTSPVINDPDGTTFSFTANDPRGALVDLSNIVTATDLGQPITVSCATSTGIELLPLPTASSGVWLLPGDYDVTCTASDGSTTSIDVSVDIVVAIEDNDPPVITVPVDAVFSGDYVDPFNPDWTFVSDGELAADVFAEDVVSGTIDPANISCSRVYPEPAPIPLPDANEFEFSDEPYTIECTATDAAGNEGTASYPLTVNYRYDINLIPPKGRARAGSTVPLDWQYLDQYGPIDSSAIHVAISWAHMADDKCLTTPDPLPTDGSSTVIDTDSGNSDFRYSNSNDTWQFSWQSPDALGPHKVSISPAGANVKDAWECVYLR